MEWSSELNLHPVSKRVLSSLCTQLDIGKTAFYLGAGVDWQLVADSTDKDIKEGFLTWKGLLKELKVFPEIDEKEFDNYANFWAAETAFIKRLEIGAEDLNTKIKEITDRFCEPNLNAAFTNALCSTLLKSNLIVTTNYTSYIYNTLLKFIENKSEKIAAREIIVLDREDLATFQFPLPEANPERIFLIHLHGRCSERSFPILDAWGYNIATQDDRYYRQFLNALFANRSVISVGTSWIDVPLRNQAAFVYRTLSYLRPSHIGFDFILGEEDFVNQIRATSPKRKWANVMRAAYGVNMTAVTGKTQITLLKELDLCHNPPESNFGIDLTKSNLGKIADFLDFCGDYESPLQISWLINATKEKELNEAERIKKSLMKIFNILAECLDNNKIEWSSAARIERHLRHHLYLYFHNDKIYSRSVLWNKLAGRINNRKLEEIEDRLRFDFLCGQFEISNCKKIEGFDKDNDCYSKRLKLAPEIWCFKSENFNDEIIKKRLSVAENLLALGWESMASKVILDLSTSLASKLSNEKSTLQENNIFQVTKYSVHSETIARSVGCFRRQMKAEVLTAMWSPDIREGRIRVLNQLRAAEAFSVIENTANINSHKESVFEVEPGLMAGFAAGLLCSHTKNLRQRFSREDLPKKIEESRESLWQEAGIKLNDVTKTLYPYWLGFAPPDVKEFMKVE